jgi:hypothetical protein
MRVMLAFVLAVNAAGCGAAGHFHYVSDNRRVDEDPARFKQFEVDKAVCDGRSAKAFLEGNAGGLVGAEAVNIVFRGCMAEKGYIVRR